MHVKHSFVTALSDDCARLMRVDASCTARDFWLDPIGVIQQGVALNGGNTADEGQESQQIDKATGIDCPGPASRS
jgi:hypothetical protein